MNDIGDRGGYSPSATASNWENGGNEPGGYAAVDIGGCKNDINGS